jgi:hypothetical protein
MAVSVSEQEPVTVMSIVAATLNSTLSSGLLSTYVHKLLHLQNPLMVFISSKFQFQYQCQDALLNCYFFCVLLILLPI